MSRWEFMHDADGDFALFEGKRLVVITDADTEWDAANARLIAAAPELLEALEHVYAEWRTLACQCISSRQMNAGHKGCIVAKGMPKVDAAIRKAKGE